MGKTIWHGLFAACLILAPQIHAVDYGVGFSLSLDYGLASVYFPNGSRADIAKVEGGPAYKQMIRATDVLDGPDALKPDIGAAQAYLSLQSLPPWLGGIDARAQSLVPMLKALKTATESYLEAPLSVAEVHPAGVPVAWAYGLGGKCEHDPIGKTPDQTPEDGPEQLILTVDYSRAALTALLVTEECGLFEYERVLHDTSLGADHLFGGSNSSGSDSTREDIVRALRNLTSLPLLRSNTEDLKRISNLVLMGQSASERRLHDVLKEVLAEHSGDLVTTLSDERPMIIDPLFAASRAAAEDCWAREDYSQFVEEHAILRELIRAG